MEIPREALLLRIFIIENHRYHRLPLYEAIVLKAREMHLAGVSRAAVFRGNGAGSAAHYFVGTGA
jgi:uncharacterized protein